ncbi:MAG: hypothetical protein AAF790_04760 [Planctomycetota bacterium]
MVAVDAADRDTAASIIDTLADAGHAAVWLPRRQPGPLAAGFSAAVWSGGQLDGRNAHLLGEFCTRMRAFSAPVVALLDFPRRDELSLATRLGVASLLGKPWASDALIAAIDHATASMPEAGTGSLRSAA